MTGGEAGCACRWMVLRIGSFTNNAYDQEVRSFVRSFVRFVKRERTSQNACRRTTIDRAREVFCYVYVEAKARGREAFGYRR